MLLEILKDDDPVLREISEPLSDEEITSDKTFKLSFNMAETMNASNGIGLAAPQVGVLKRLIVVHIHDRYVTMINPEIIKSRKEFIHKNEMCLSFPGYKTDIKRNKFITVRYTDLKGKVETVKYSGLNAVCIQHEIDHLDGIVIADS